ncbi:MAG: hypothetical protein KJO07_18190, partial [Deltaproteobacteria bacterium]|nr:hypothetical protein [Deltaproteobacteria bacterium]
LQIDVTEAPYGADPSGGVDSTAAIQAAIDDVGQAGGGVVHLPPGTYRVAPPAGKQQALHIGYSGVVVRGAGPQQTRILNTATNMRTKRIIDVRPDPDVHYIWYHDAGDSVALSEDADIGARSIRLTGLGDYQVGDWVVVRADASDAFLDEHGMLGTWNPQFAGLAFYRQIIAIDAGSKTVELDVPLRYPVKTRDNARIHRTKDHLEEVGIEKLSIGNLRNSTPGMDTDDYQIPGTGGYQVHASFAIYLTLVVNGWVDDVHSYEAPGNGGVHILSSGLRLDSSRFVTVRDCDFRHPQYEGAGGNGYLFVHTGSENLITESTGIDGRHNFTFSLMYSSGNVIHRSRSQDGRLPADFHQLLSMTNLVDNMAVDNDSLEAIFRDCCGHGHSTTESVYWNTHGLSYPWDQFFFKFIIESQQFGHGYVIGTRGPADKVENPSGDGTAPKDWVEGEGMGDSLEPQSLYDEQLARRLGTYVPPGEGSDGGPGGGGDGGAGGGSDAGTGGTEGPGPNDGGCSAAGGSAPGWGLMVLAALATIRRRRR